MLAAVFGLSPVTMRTSIPARGGEHLADLRGRLDGEVPGRRADALDGAADVVLAALQGDHAHTGVLEGGGAVALLALEGLVGRPLGLHGHDPHRRAVVLEEQLLACRDVGVVGVHHYGQAEDVAILQLHRLHHCVVLVLVEEAGER